MMRAGLIAVLVVAVVAFILDSVAYMFVFTPTPEDDRVLEASSSC